jgi:hypothetical protein
MKDRYTYLIVPFICFLFFFTNAKAQILLVPEIEQEQNEWCWAGVSKCVLDYYGYPHQQCEIAEYTRNIATWNNFGIVDCCLDPSQGCNYWNYMYGSGGSIQDILFNFGGITTNNSSSTLSQAQWQAEITNNTPFIVRYGWNGGGGHFVVGYGVSGSDYFTMDPWFNEGYTISTYNWVVTAQGGGGSWTHSQTLSPSPIIGCTDSLACNFNALAIIDNSLCGYYNSFSYDTLSSNASIVWNGLPLSVSGDYSVTLMNSVGCDSIVNLNLTVTTTGILDIANNKSNLIKIIDMLGQETPYRRNTPLFYIYDDGTVEKRIVIE